METKSPYLELKLQLKKLLIVVCDKSTKAPARLYADHFINSSIYEPLEIYKKIKKKKKIENRRYHESKC